MLCVMILVKSTFMPQLYIVNSYLNNLVNIKKFWELTTPPLNSEIPKFPKKVMKVRLTEKMTDFRYYDNDDDDDDDSRGGVP